MSVKAVIKEIAYYLPKQIVTNAMLSIQFPEWPAEQIALKTGIWQRHIAAEEECSSDLAYKAAVTLLTSGNARPQDVDFVLFCTQTPDCLIPTTACLLQDRLSIPTSAGALDYNLGCSGYVYGLSIAKGLIETEQVRTVLLLTGETYSKVIAPEDKSVKTIFGDAGTATLLVGDGLENASRIGAFHFGTDGSGEKHLRCHQQAFRKYDQTSPGSQYLWMDGPEIFNFTISIIPKAIAQALHKSGLRCEDIDHFVFHQANRFMLEHLRKRMQIPESKFVIEMEDIGNTVSCSIPIAMARLVEQGRLQRGHTLLLVGFGVGYSWGITVVRW